MSKLRLFNTAAKAVLLAGTFLTAIATSALTIPNVPLTVQQSVKPMIMLVAGKDHRFFYEAYNDASDVDGDGTLDIRFKPSITYLGLFQSNLCYEHNTKSDNTGLFTPAAAVIPLDASNTVPNRCAQPSPSAPTRWSGNWLNYVTTSRIDALRVVLYGGFREVDTGTSTILRRAYIPQDAHSWAKEYKDVATDGYNISDFAGVKLPATNKRHFFGNATMNATTNCATLSNCSGMPPLLSVITDSPNRVWEWASTERPVLRDDTHGGTRTNLTVRVQVCTDTFHENCKQYPDKNYKPVGLLHDYGETDQMLFGLLTGTYDQNMSGGRLRKVVSSFKNEVNSATNGSFTSNDTIVSTFDNLRIRDFNNGRTDNAYKGGWLTTGPPANAQFPDWGNPIGEMMYEAVRYFTGKKSATARYSVSNTIDREVGLTTATWDDPYESTSAAAAPSCARGNMLVISDINVSYDSDELPGVNSNFSVAFSGDLPGLNVSTFAKTISDSEPDVAGSHFIGQSGASFDSAPTAKTVTDLGTIRGIAPEEPTKQGSYYSAAVAHYAKVTDLRSDKTGSQTLDTFVVALASPLPRITIPLPNKDSITLVPFAKSVSGSGITSTKGGYQPTNQIVDFYVEQIANSGAGDTNNAINNGRYYAKFRINFEDVEQGADHDMDAIAQYEVTANADSSVTVSVAVIYEAGGIQHRIGYIMSGTKADGIYLVAQDEADQTPYFLNVPIFTKNGITVQATPGYCDGANLNNTECKRVKYHDGANNITQTATFTFQPDATKSAATLLKDPLWYAAKWGGFVDGNGNNKPDIKDEWDLDGDGVPDTYFLVQNPVKLKAALKKALDAIAGRSSSASNISANSTSISTDSSLYQAVFNTQRWSGDLIAYPALANGVGATASWTASKKLPAWDQRKIFMRTTDGATSPSTPTLSTVRMNDYSTLSAADKATLVSANVYNYLRGDRSNELQKDGTFRDREHPLGDIVQSSPFYEKTQRVIYVGGNDGMLHAFNADEEDSTGKGTEIFAFIPRESVSHLARLSSVAYSHEYFVDGDVMVGDVANSNKSYAFTQLGRGGRGLFALDVTDPKNFSASNFLWEYTPSGSTAAAADNDLGYMLGRGTFVKLANGKQALIVGNGYKSANLKAVLYVFIINDDGSLASVQKVPTATGSDNGLATPVAIDTDNDGVADTIYAGDLEGNVWKFDISGSDPTAWPAPTKLFTAKDSLGNVQPITAPLFTAIDDKSGDPNLGKRFIFFGTGAYFRTGDPDDGAVQSWYGIIDDGTTIAGRASLRQRTVNNTGTYNGSAVRTFSPAVSGDMVGKKGWYLDFTTPKTGERVVTTSRIVQFAIPALMSSSLYPVPSDPCVPGGNGYLNIIDPFSGGGLTTGLLDLNLDANFGNDVLGSQPIGSVDLGIGIPTEPLTLTAPGAKVNIYIGGSGTTTTTGSLIKYISGLGGAGALKGRISWREIVRD